MSRIAFDLGFIQIYWYSIMIALALLVGSMVMILECRRQKMDEDKFVNLLFWGVIIAIIGARAYYVLFNWSYYSKNLIEVLEVWNGGLAIHGAMIGGGLFVIYYCHKNKLNWLKTIDVIVLGLIIGQAIGRWGNFFNQEAHGGIVTLEYLQKMNIPEFVIKGMHIGGVYYEPLFLYESVLCVIGFIILMIAKRFRYIKIGQLTSLYMIWYGICRFIVESKRTDSLMLGNFRVAQIVSALMIVVGILFFFYRVKKSKLDDLYNTKYNPSSIQQ
jgi:phosphatidylglycerol:prolipoprotein diacylglycerol transferase